MSAPLDDYDGLEDSRRGYELWCNLKRAELHDCAVEAAIERLREALRKHGRPNEVVTPCFRSQAPAFKPGLVRRANVAFCAAMAYKSGTAARANGLPPLTAAMYEVALAGQTLLIRRAHVYRLCPTVEQAAVLSRWVGVVRATYNAALEQRRNWYRPGRNFNFATQCREVTALRAEFDWVREVPVHPLQQAIKDLDRAFQNWWSGHAKAPRPRKRGINDSLRFPDPATFDFRRLSRHLGEVKLPKLGWVRLRWDREIPGAVKGITVKRYAGQWTVAAQYEAEIAEPAPSQLPAVGIDRGVAVFAALSDGTLIEPVNVAKKAQKTLARAQRKLARKKKGSANRRKQVRRIARLHARVRAVRRDFLHKVSTTIAKSHGPVVVEKLEIRNMVRSAAGTLAKPGRNVRAKSGLNRAILDQGWGAFREMLAYKLAQRGGQLIEVPAAYSSQTCAECGAVEAKSRNGLRFACAACGHQNHSDTNAARVILQRGRDTALLLSEASGCRAGEERTIREIA